MVVKIKIPVSLERLTGGIKYISTVSGCFSEILKDIKNNYPQLFKKITTSQGDLKGYVLIFQKGPDIKDVVKKNTLVKDGQELQILLAVAGG